MCVCVFENVRHKLRSRLVCVYVSLQYLHGSTTTELQEPLSTETGDRWITGKRARLEEEGASKV